MNHDSKKTRSFAGALVLTIGAGPAMAQDSVSAAPGLPGDALDPYSVDQQVVPYVVDLTTLTTSFGNEFGVAPVAKASKGSPDFFNALISAQGVSRNMLVDVPFPADEYAVWSEPGFGVNPEQNEVPEMIAAPTETGNQIGVAFAEFDGEMNNIVGALVNRDPADPTRLFVTRVSAAQNAANFGENNAQFGTGVVDASGNATFRADGFGVGGNVSPGFVPLGQSGPGDQNIFRIGMADRASGMMNIIDDTGGTDATATDRPLHNTVTAHNVPNAIPEALAARPVYIGSNFDTQYVFESAPNSTSATDDHLDGLSANADHRGAVAFSTSECFEGSVGTAGVLAKSAGAETDTISVWGVDQNGAIVGTPQHVTIPAAGATDPIDPFTYTPPSGADAFDHYHSQAAFRGGSSQVALGSDQAGRCLAAATAYIVGGNTDPSNTIPVARFEPDSEGGADQWSLAAWVDATVIGEWPEGKPIRNAAGEAIGELTTLFQVTEGDPFGPSFSSPGIDSVGNIWFLSAVQIYEGDDDDAMEFTGDLVPPDGDDAYTTGLIRAVYNPDTFGYELELVLKVGDTFEGQNSGRNYTINFMEIADDDSVSSGTFFSGNVTEAAANGMDTTDLDPADPRTLGGLIVNVSIAYDTEPQEFYNTVLFVGATEGQGVCFGDLNGDAVVDGADLGLLLGAWGDNPGSPADLNGDDSVNGADLGLLLGAWGQCS